MNFPVKQIDNNLILCLSSDGYFLNIIHGDKVQYRFDADQKIIYFGSIGQNTILPSQGNQQKNVKGRFVIVINRKLLWSIYLVQKQRQPIVVLEGRISCQKQSELIDYNYSGHFQIVNVHQIGNKLLILFSDLRIYELKINEKAKKQIEQLIKNPKLGTPHNPTLITSSLTHPTTQQTYLSCQYLPSPQTSLIYKSLAFNLPTSNQSEFQLYIAFRSKNSQKQGQFLHSLYSVVFDSREMKVLSGRNCLMNIEEQIIGLWLMSEAQDRILVQTRKCVYLWMKDNQILEYSQFTIPYPLTLLYSKKQQTYVGVVDNLDKPHSNSVQIVQVSLSQQKNSLLFKTFLEIDSLNEKPIAYFHNSEKAQDSYFFLADYSIVKTKKSKNESIQTIIFQDHSIFIDSAKQILIEPITNLLYLKKRKGFSNKSIVITNSFIQTNQQRFSHNLPLKASNIISSTQVHNRFQLYLTSPRIGFITLKIQKQNHNNIQISILQQFKGLSNYECLSIANSGSMLVNPHQIVFSLQSNKQGQYQTALISKIFQGSVQYIEDAIIFEKTSTFVFAIEDQIHVFEGNSKKNFKRKYIHCCKGPIKKLFKFNNVNVIGFELYKNHNQYEHFQHELQLYAVGQDKLSKLKSIDYHQQSCIGQLFSFLSHINTVPYIFNFIYGKLVIVSSQETHRYNVQKIQIHAYDYFLPVQSNTVFYIVPVLNLTTQNKKQENQFIVISQDRISQKTQILIGSFNKKFLIKQFDQIKFNFQILVSSVNLLKEKVVFGTLISENNQNQKRRNLTLFTQKNCYILQLKKGTIQLQNFDNSTPNFTQRLVQPHFSSDLKNFSGLQNIGKNFNISSRESQFLRNQLRTQTNTLELVIIYNQFQLWLANINQQKSQVKLISVYTMINNEFQQFRNNLSVQQLQQPQFMKIFSAKQSIIQVKYLDDKAIIVLFQKQITVLQVGQNYSLTVRQEIKFDKAVGVENDLDKQEGFFRIVQLLDRFSPTDIFLKDSQERLFTLQFNAKAQNYQIKFNRNIDQDIVYIGQVYNWDQQRIPFFLSHTKTPSQQINHFYHNSASQIIIKKDSQIVVKNLITKKETMQYA